MSTRSPWSRWPRHAGLIGFGGLIAFAGWRLLAPDVWIDRRTPHGDVPPIERLGRWTGETFAPVAAGSVTAPRAIVMVHGWGHNLAAAVAADPARSLPLIWDAAIRRSHAPFFRDFVDLARAVSSESVAVLAYSWIDDSATGIDPLDARHSLERTAMNGARLAAAMQQVMPVSFEWANLHLVGHSHGARVATLAALELPDPPGQLTLLDAPEDAAARDDRAAVDLARLLARLRPGRTDGVFVDSYISLFGEPYHDDPGTGEIVDVRLRPPDGLLDMKDRHRYATAWYAASALHHLAGVGYGWNRWARPDRTALARLYDQVSPDGDGAAPLELRMTVPYR